MRMNANDIEQPIFLSPPHMGGAEKKYIEQVFASNYIAPCGDMVAKFEQDFVRLTGFKYCLALSSGTAAMQLIMHHLKIKPNDLILASTLTFIASVSSAYHFGADIKFIDCDPNSWNIDLDLLSKELEVCAKKGKLPKAVIPTDLYGQCVPTDKIVEICNKYGVPVIMDSAEAVGAYYQGRHAGKGSYAAIYSFNGNKVVTTSGGGMLATDNQELFDHALFLANQAKEPLPYYEHKEVGYNYRMSSVVAAIGRGQLQVLPERVKRKKEIYQLYKATLGNISGISFMPIVEGGEPNYWLTSIIIDDNKLTINNDQLRLILKENNIESKLLWKPMHLQPVFDNSKICGGKISEFLFKHGLCLPSGTAMTDKQLFRIADIIKQALLKSQI